MQTALKICPETTLNMHLEGFNSNICQIHDFGDASDTTSFSDRAFAQRHLIMLLMNEKQ